MRVLVVDDEAVARELAIEVLVDAGFDALGANDPVQAMEVLGEAEPAIDVLLTDVRMPGGSGIDLAGIAKRLWPGLKVVIT